MNKALEIAGIIKEIGKLIEDLPGARLTINAEEDYCMLRISSNPRREFVILDLKSAAGKGMIVLNNLRISLRTPYIIVITNLNTEDFKSRCVELGADYFFDKNKDKHEFSKLLNKHLMTVKNAYFSDVSPA